MRGPHGKRWSDSRAVSFSLLAPLVWIFAWGGGAPRPLKGGRFLRKAWLLFLASLGLLGNAWAAGQAASAAFFRAVREGDVAGVTAFLGEGVSPDAREDGKPALIVAIEKQQPAMARLLVERGADVNAMPPNRSSALQYAILRGYDAYALKATPGYPELIRLLLAKGADPNNVDVDGCNPLITAAEKDDVTTIQLLLERGADLAHENNKGWLALDRAVNYQRRAAARTLVAAGAPLDPEQAKVKQRYDFARLAGRWFPALLLGSFVLAGWMARKQKTAPKREAALRAGDDLPALAPLKCGACGGSASLRPGVATCASCHQPVPVPEDYTKTLSLRARTFRLMERAVKLWRRVRIVSSSPIQIALWVGGLWFAIRVWQGVMPSFARVALFDLMTFRGTMVWALSVLAMAAVPIACWIYALYLWSVREKIPAAPMMGKEIGEAGTIQCRNCGGMLEFRPGDLVGVCGYCGGETYRVALARRARTAAMGENDDATLSLYNAMMEVYELRATAAMAVPMAMVVIGLILVVVLRVALLFV